MILHHKTKKILQSKPMPKFTDPYNEICHKIYRTALYRGETLKETIDYINDYDHLKKNFNKEYRVSFHKFKLWYNKLNEKQKKKLDFQHKLIIEIYYSEDKFMAFVKGTY